MADPGFSPGGGGANSQNCYYFSHFCRKLHENERIWTPRGGARVPGAPPWIRQCIVTIVHVIIVTEENIIEKNPRVAKIYHQIPSGNFFSRGGGVVP